VKPYKGQACPAERLNGKRYADHGLESLLISGAMNGVEMDQQNPLSPGHIVLSDNCVEVVLHDDVR
jgi:hypothetical protein